MEAGQRRNVRELVVKMEWEIVDEYDEMKRVEEVGKAFVDQYYYLFDNCRPNLAVFYEHRSTMSFEGHKIVGAHDISLKLASLPFDECKHFISTVDCQPSHAISGGIAILVSGNLHLGGEEHPLRFSQVFHVVPTPEGSFNIVNDIFRLNYG